MPSNLKKKAGLVIIELSHTIYHPGLEPIAPPFVLEGLQLVDAKLQPINHYPESPRVLKFLRDEGFAIVAASRKIEISAAQEIINIFGWDEYFTYKEIYPAIKRYHFRQFQVENKLPPTSMLFLDDDEGNMREISMIGVHCVRVEDGGVNMKLVKDALRHFPNTDTKDE